MGTGFRQSPVDERTQKMQPSYMVHASITYSLPGTTPKPYTFPTQKDEKVSMMR